MYTCWYSEQSCASGPVSVIIRGCFTSIVLLWRIPLRFHYILVVEYHRLARPRLLEARRAQTMSCRNLGRCGVISNNPLAHHEICQSCAAMPTVLFINSIAIDPTLCAPCINKSRYRTALLALLPQVRSKIGTKSYPSYTT
jgi:hypothetical protein